MISPSAAAQARTGGTTSPTVAELKHFAINLVTGGELRMSINKVSRLVEHFHARMPHGSGWMFFEYLLAQVQATVEHRKAIIAWVSARDDLEYLLHYHDPVGEEASANVDRKRREKQRAER